MLEISNKRKIILLILTLLISLSTNIYNIKKYDEEVIIKEENDERLKNVKSEAKAWEEKKKRLQFIKLNFPDLDVENTLLGFSNRVDNLSKEVGIDLNDIEVNMETLRSEGKLVFIDMDVKVNGSSATLSHFMNLSRQDDFIHVRKINTKYNREKDTNEILVKYELIAHSQPKVNKISNPDDLIKNVMGTGFIQRNIMGEWVDFFTYKKQMKELEKYGYIKEKDKSGKVENKTKQAIKEGRIIEENIYTRGSFTNNTEKPKAVPGLGPRIEVEGSITNNNKEEVLTDAKPQQDKLKEKETIDNKKFIAPTDSLNIIKKFSTDYMGIDVAINKASKIRSIEDGKVIFAGDMEPHGNTVIIDHGNNIKSLYGNLGEILIKNNENIKKSSTLGLSGVTEGVEYYHFRLSDGEFIDPSKYIKED